MHIFGMMTHNDKEYAENRGAIFLMEALIWWLNTRRTIMEYPPCLNILLFWQRSTAALVFQVGTCFEVLVFCPHFPTCPRP